MEGGIACGNLGGTTQMEDPEKDTIRNRRLRHPLSPNLHRRGGTDPFARRRTYIARSHPGGYQRHPTAREERQLFMNWIDHHVWKIGWLSLGGYLELVLVVVFR
jgi:hypothetical protein